MTTSDYNSIIASIALQIGDLASSSANKLQLGSCNAHIFKQKRFYKAAQNYKLP